MNGEMVLDAEESSIQGKPAAYDCWESLAWISQTIFETEATEVSLKAMRERLEKLEGIQDAMADKDIQKGCELLSRFLVKVDSSENIDEIIEKLAVEFATFFYGVGNTPVFPIESVYKGREHTLYERPFFEVVECYKAWDFKGIEGLEEPLDHLAHEIAYMRFQVEKAQDALENGRTQESAERVEDVIAFNREHLGRWVPEFSDRLISQTRSAYYLAGAHFVLGLSNSFERWMSKIFKG